MRSLVLVDTFEVWVDDEDPNEARAVLDYMGEHCADATLENVSDRFGFHPNTLAALVKRATGTTFSQTMRSMRMRRAGRLLLDGGVSVERAARDCGYRSPAAFARVFRQTYGMTPGAYAASRRVP